MARGPVGGRPHGSPEISLQIIKGGAQQGRYRLVEMRLSALSVTLLAVTLLSLSTATEGAEGPLPGLGKRNGDRPALIDTEEPSNKRQFRGGDRNTTDVVAELYSRAGWGFPELTDSAVDSTTRADMASRTRQAIVHAIYHAVLEPVTPDNAENSRLLEFVLENFRSAIGQGKVYDELEGLLRGCDDEASNALKVAAMTGLGEHAQEELQSIVITLLASSEHDDSSYRAGHLTEAGQKSIEALKGFLGAVPSEKAVDISKWVMDVASLREGRYRRKPYEEGGLLRAICDSTFKHFEAVLSNPSCEHHSSMIYYMVARSGMQTIYPGLVAPEELDTKWVNVFKQMSLDEKMERIGEYLGEGFQTSVISKRDRLEYYGRLLTMMKEFASESRIHSLMFESEYLYHLARLLQSLEKECRGKECSELEDYLYYYQDVRDTFVQACTTYFHLRGPSPYPQAIPATQTSPRNDYASFPDHVSHMTRTKNARK